MSATKQRNGSTRKWRATRARLLRQLPVLCELCGTPTAPSDLIESRVRTIRRLDMGAGIGQIGDGTGISSIWLCPTCPVP